MIGLFQKKDKVWGDLTVLTHDLRDMLKPLLFCSQGYSETCFFMPIQSNLRRLRCRGIRSFSFILLLILPTWSSLLHLCLVRLFQSDKFATMAGAGESLFAMLAQLVGSYCKGAADFTYLGKGFQWEKCFLRQPTSWMKMPCQPPSNACKCEDLAVASCYVWLSGVWTYKIFFVSATHCSRMISRRGDFSGIGS